MPYDRVSRADTGDTFYLDRPNPGASLDRVHRGLQGLPPFNDPRVGYLGLSGGTKRVQFIFSVEPRQAVVDALDAYLSGGLFPTPPPRPKDEYRNLTTDSERIDFIARQLGLL